MPTARLLSLLLIIGLAGMRASAAAPETGMGRIPVLTRTVQIFTQLETDLDEALAKRDAAAVTKLLAEDFEMRVGSMPGNPIPRAAWVNQSIAEPKSSTFIEQMAVHDFGKLAVVSYSRKGKVAKAAAAHEIFIVDIWTRGPDNNWRLSIRYAGPAGKGDFLIPGVPMNAPVFEKKE